MSHQRRLVEIFKSPRKQEMYLYVDKANGLKGIPDGLLEQFGEPESVMVLALNADRALARADAGEVLAAIETQGFYLQMPPSAEELRRRETSA